MSRIIVKNIPKGISEQKLKDIFSEKGIVTDVQLKYNKDGVSRNFGFIGYETEAEAEAAASYFNNICINTRRIDVKLCKSLKASEKEIENFSGSREDIKEDKNDSFDEHKNDPLFLEFMLSHARDKTVWESDIIVPQQQNLKSDHTVVQKDVHIREEEKKPMIKLYTVKLMNTPYNTKRSEILKFFKPIKPHSIRTRHGFCFAGFKTEVEFKKALARNRSFLKKNQIEIVDYSERNELDLKLSKQQEFQKWEKQNESITNEDSIIETGRIYFRNLPYSSTEEELTNLFEKYGPVTEINMPIDNDTKKIKGFGTVTFMLPENAVSAFNELNGTSFHGRLLHLMPGKLRDKPEINFNKLTPKEIKLAKQKQTAGNSFNWNSFFLGTNTVADVLANNYNEAKKNVLDTAAGSSSAAVRLALGETEIVQNMKNYLEENGICLDVFNGVSEKLSKTTIIAKNLPSGTTYEEINKLFSQFGIIGKILLPPSGVTAIIDFLEITEAKRAYKKLSYSKFKHLPLYLEWAPENIIKNRNTTNTNNHQSLGDNNAKDVKNNDICEKNDEIHKNDSTIQTMENNSKDESTENGTTIFLRNLNFQTTEKTVREHFQHVGFISSVQIAMKKNRSGEIDKSLGYGFIQFKMKKSAEKALKEMQFTKIDENIVELKRSDRTLKTDKINHKPAVIENQTGTKILVRNIPFQAKENEVRDLFKVFGNLRSVRLPLKMGEETHRGFGFVDFLTKSDAKKAFEALCQSTHLYGRRLVLEWAKIEDDNVDQLRKRTAHHFVSDNFSKVSRKSVFNTFETDIVNEYGEE